MAIAISTAYQNLREIAAMMGMSYSNARVVHKKALGRLKELLVQKGGIVLKAHLRALLRNLASLEMKIQF